MGNISYDVSSSSENGSVVFCFFFFIIKTLKNWFSALHIFFAAPPQCPSQGKSLPFFLMLSQSAPSSPCAAARPVHISTIALSAVCYNWLFVRLQYKTEGLVSERSLWSPAWHIIDTH